MFTLGIVPILPLRHNGCRRFFLADDPSGQTEGAMSHPLRSDPFVAAEIESAIQPYVGMLPDEDLEWMREQLACTLADDEGASALLSAAHPRSDVDESGTRSRSPGMKKLAEEAEAKERRR